MKRRLTILTGLLLMAATISGTGCAPAPYHGGHYPPDVVVVYEPVPYPVPGGDYVPPPPPPRHSPLTPASDSGNPRTETPRKERGSDDRITKPRTRDDKQSLAQQAGHPTTRSPLGNRR